ncbi:hypothetical protein PS691_04959 [Pseudomonas fluorescens]|uniref:Uncharacterized protein n=1 Tax=Pseudomonas fluorescens TaxID=294 RepID=A0A5E7EW91_PSEFL|nr:hypothetical protein PS691_04959 [Pseudomonas fluorescens]
MTVYEAVAVMALDMITAVFDPLVIIRDVAPPTCSNLLH